MKGLVLRGQALTLVLLNLEARFQSEQISQIDLFS